MNADKLPVPCLTIDASCRILERTEAARAVFPVCTHFIELADPGSTGKILQFLTPEHSGLRVEANLRTVESPCELFELYQQWEKGEDGARGHLVCIPQQDRMNEWHGRIRQLRERLGQTMGEQGTLRGGHLVALPVKRTSPMEGSQSDEAAEKSFDGHARRGTNRKALVAFEIKSSLNTLGDIVAQLRTRTNHSAAVGKAEGADRFGVSGE